MSNFIKMKSALVIFTMLLGIHITGYAQHGTGLINDPNQEGLFKEKDASTLGYGEKVPSSYSMKAYTPFVKSQGQYGTCTAWAAAYSAYTTAYAMQIGLTNRNLITALSFCPYYVYNKANGDNSCSEGTTLETALTYMIESGVKRFYMPVIGCGTKITPDLDADASKNKIKDAFILYDVTTYPADNSAASVSRFLLNKPKADISKIKAALASGKPVVFGGYVASSFMNVSGTDVWRASSDEKANPGQAVIDNTGMHQQHAMCIIGYDDNKYGGAFEIINSWSELWGNEGYIWVPYDDWALFNYKAFWLDIGTSNLELLRDKGCAEGNCDEGYGIYKYDNGERYEGHFKNGKRNGYGIYTWPTGAAYGGEWLNDARHGEAVVYLTNGNYGTCVYKDNVQMTGYGDWVYNNGDKYVGSLSDNYIRNGYGTYIFSDGRKYTGSHVSDKFSGLGKMEWANGDKYIGEWSDNERNGYGMYIAANGKVQAGNWSYGVLKKGQSYGFAGTDDTVKINFSDIFSAINYATADCLSGDCLNGKGTKKYNSGLIYTGEFKDALEHGYGTWTYTDGGKQTGYFQQGKPNGVFKATFAEGGYVIGDYAKGEVNGYAIFVYPSGGFIVQSYSNGRYIREVPPTGDIMNMQLSPEQFGSNPRTEGEVSKSE